MTTTPRCLWVEAAIKLIEAKTSPAEAAQLERLQIQQDVLGNTVKIETGKMRFSEELMHYTLHAAPGSCSFAPHIVMEEIGRPYSLALMSLGHPEAKTDEFRRLNPKGRIPVLIAENFTLTEAPAILVHLGLTNPDAGLLGADAENIVRSIEWFNWLSSAVHAVAVRMIWRADFFLPEQSMYAPLIDKGKEHLASAFALIESKLTDRDWAVGKSYSIVDPYLLVFYRWGNRMAVDMRNTYPAWTSHARRLEERAAVQRALTQEGISLWE